MAEAVSTLVVGMAALAPHLALADLVTQEVVAGGLAAVTESRVPVGLAVPVWWRFTSMCSKFVSYEAEIPPPIPEAAATGKRAWRRPTEEDKHREKCRARSPFEHRPFYVQWNEEWKCWGLYGRSHILVAVSEILSPSQLTRS